MRCSIAFLALLLLSTAPLAQTTTAVPWLPQEWDTAFGYNGINAPAEEMVLFDDGSGPKLYVCGPIYLAGGSVPQGLARWDGTRWEAVPVFPGASQTFGFTDMTVHDDGSGPRLFVSSRGAVAAWDGTGWEVFPVTGVGTVGVFAMHSDGNTLYAGGRMSSIDGVPVKTIARYDGTQWHAMGIGFGQGLPWTVRAITVSDAQGPSRVYAGIDGSGGSLDALFWWDGVDWIPVPNVTGAVGALAHFPSAGGPQLILAESSTPLQALTSSGLAPLHPNAPTDTTSLKVEIEGSIANLFVMGGFKTIGGLAVEGLARWNGSGWFAVGGAPFNLGPFDGIWSTASGDVGNGFERFVSGTFNVLNGQSMREIASYRAGAWRPVGQGESVRGWITGGFVQAIGEFDDGGGTDVYIAGDFTEAGASGASGIARWEGDHWEALASQPPLARIVSFEVFDDGTGPALYAGGDYSIQPPGIARWDGTSWSLLGSGIIGSVEDMTVYDDGSGPALYVGGNFSQAGGTATLNLARWDGTSWSSIGDVGTTNSAVAALEVFDDGNGARLYVGGGFAQVAGIPASHIAAWDGTSWDPMINGVNGSVTELLAADLPEIGGARLLVAGYMSGGITRWTGSAWHKSFGFPPRNGNHMAIWDDGTGPRLYAQTKPLPPLTDSLLYRFGASGWELLEQVDPPTLITVEAMFADSNPNASSLWFGGGIITMDGEHASVGIARRFRRRAPFSFETTPLTGVGLNHGPTLVGSYAHETDEVVVHIEGAPSEGEAVFFFGSELAPGSKASGLAITAVRHARIQLAAESELRGSLPDLAEGKLYVQALVRRPGSQPIWSKVLRIESGVRPN